MFFKGQHFYSILRFARRGNCVRPRETGGLSYGVSSRCLCHGHLRRGFGWFDTLCHDPCHELMSCIMISRASRSMNWITDILNAPWRNSWRSQFMGLGFNLCRFRQFVASALARIQHILNKIPYPVAGSFTITCVTAPTSLPSWMIGLPDRSVVK